MAPNLDSGRSAGPAGGVMGASQHLDINASHVHPQGMRTTLQIDDDVYRAARSLAAAEGRSLGEVISSLARKGLAPAEGPATHKGLPAFRVARDAPRITPDMVRRALDDA